jgi:Domain of unknown function (DUF4159)
MNASRKIILAASGVLAIGICAAQNFGGGRGRHFRGGWGGYRGWGSPDAPLITTEGGETVNEDTVRTARETAVHSTEVSDWTNAAGFDRDVFTFVRILYRWNSEDPGAAGTPGMLRWINDYPDADLNLSFRLQQLTSLKVNPDGRVLKLTDPDLANYPFIYMVQPWGLDLTDEEVPILRKYLLNGGVLMADDFWGDSGWNDFAAQMKRVLPERTWTELPMSHPIFHCVFPIIATNLNKLQVPSLPLWDGSDNSDSGHYGGWRARRGDGSPDMHVRAWLDDRGRIMVIATHNTDNGDGWEREGENHDYFQIFSEQRAYPLGINIIYYIMTH